MATRSYFDFFFFFASRQQMFKSQQRNGKRELLHFPYSEKKLNHFLTKFTIEWLSYRTSRLMYEVVLSFFIVTVWWFVFLHPIRRLLSSTRLSVFSLFFGFLVRVFFIFFSFLCKRCSDCHQSQQTLGFNQFSFATTCILGISWAQLGLPLFWTSAEDSF